MTVNHSIAILPFKIESYDAVRLLWQTCEGLGLSEADSRENIQVFLRRNPGLSFIAQIDDRVVGSLLGAQDGRRGFLYHLAVHPAYRRQGLGRRLVDRCLDRLQEIGIEKCHVFVFAENSAGVEFWKSLDWQPRTDLLVLSKLLSG